MPNHTDITTRAGKGPLPHLHCSTTLYRAEYDRIFNNKTPRKIRVETAPRTVKCTECDGFGSYIRGNSYVSCGKCDATGKLIA